MEVRIFRDYGEAKRVYIDKDVRVVVINITKDYPQGVVHFETAEGHFNEDGTPAVIVG